MQTIETNWRKRLNDIVADLRTELEPEYRLELLRELASLKSKLGWT